jgi:lipopolysaccharide transport system permease protein
VAIFSKIFLKSQERNDPGLIPRELLLRGGGDIDGARPRPHDTFKPRRKENTLMGTVRNSLSYNLALTKTIFKREFSALYRRTALGPVWALLSPAAYLAVFIFFRLLFGLSNPEGVPMLPFLFSGLTLWLLFSTTLSAVFPSIISNVSILKKMPVSPFVFVFAGALVPLFTSAVYMVLLEVLLIVYGYAPTMHHLAIPLVVIMVQAFALALGLLASTFGLYRQDIIQALPTFIQLGMFATPIFFSPSIVPEALRWVVDYNPVAQCVGMLREIIFNASWPDLASLGKTIAVIVVFGLVAFAFFKRTSRYLADLF